MHSNNTSVKKTNLNNVNRTSEGEVVENARERIKEKKLGNKEDINDIRIKIRESLEEKDNGSFTELNNLEKENNPENSCSKGITTGKYSTSKKRSAGKERLAKEIAEELNDDHSLGAFLSIADKIPEQQIRIFFSIIKDAHLTGKIKNSKGAMFISLAKVHAIKNNINLNFR